jgi:broad specificity phosphatase PhoE
MSMYDRSCESLSLVLNQNVLRRRDKFILLIRHAEVVYNAKLKKHQPASVDGPEFSGITEQGQEQIRAISSQLKKTLPSLHVYTSPTSSALKMAESISNSCLARLSVLDELRAIDLGLASRTSSGYLQSLDTYLKAWNNGLDTRLPGGETFVDLQIRTSRALRKLINDSDARFILAVSHWSTICSLLGPIMGITPIVAVNELRIEHGKPIVLRVEEDGIIRHVRYPGIRLQSCEDPSSDRYVTNP